jgi:predicted amino acid-binding ACT domain protein
MANSFTREFETLEALIEMQDQAVAALRDDLEGLGKKLNLDLVIENLDEKLRDVFGVKKTEEKEEKDEPDA